MVDTADRRRIAAARLTYLTSGAAEPAEVPGIVAASWERSRAAGVNAVTSEAVFHADLDMASRLVRCSKPIIDRLSNEAADISLSIALTDSKARVLTRVDTARTIGMLLDNVRFAAGFNYAEGGMGTNGVGTAVESGQPVQISGAEHFHERLQPFACSGAPIRDPLSRRIEGVLDISCLTEHSTPLIHSLVRSAAREIERNLLRDRSHCQQTLFDGFNRADARSHGAVIAVGSSVLIANTVAQDLLTPTEQSNIHDVARFVMGRRDRAVEQIELNTGKIVRIRTTRVLDGNDVAGMIVEVALLADVLVPPLPGTRTWQRTQSPPPRTPLGPASLIGVGQSALWKRACSDIAAAMAQHRALLVMGETGTGKSSLVAETYHRVNVGGRSVLVNSVDISPHSYDYAEIALKTTNQPTLYIFRNIDQLSATGVEELNTLLLALADSDRHLYLSATLSAASIDSDLPFRDLLVHFQDSVTVPPLRHRTDDIAGLVDQILRRIAPRAGTRLSPAALRLVRRYSWPRNITQLKEALAAALLRRPVGAIEPGDLPGYCNESAGRQLTGIEAMERDAIVGALRDAGGNRVQAAATLGLARSSLYRKLKSYGIKTI